MTMLNTCQDTVSLQIELCGPDEGYSVTLRITRITRACQLNMEVMVSTTSSEFAIDLCIRMFGMGGLYQDQSLNRNDFRSTRISKL